jgi:DNA-binding transcriptional MerR regulator
VAVTDEPLPEGRLPAPSGDEDVPRKSLTIGAVCKALSQEFPDISISKIRYLEDQKLLAPRRTPGGYRLYGQSDVSRLRTILRLQRDEFLPLRVIRQELAAGRADNDRPAGARRDRTQALRRRRPQPARVPHLGGQGGGSTRANPRPGAALAESRTAQGGR